MQSYHTEALLSASVATVWATLMDTAQYPNWNPLVGQVQGSFEAGARVKVWIVPLGKTFGATITTCVQKQELVWEGVQGAAWLLKGRHYYRLHPQSDQTTLLEHGETFTGLLSYFIPKKLLQRMKQSFIDHNHALQKKLTDDHQH